MAKEADAVEQEASALQASVAMKEEEIRAMQNGPKKLLKEKALNAVRIKAEKQADKLKQLHVKQTLKQTILRGARAISKVKKIQGAADTAGQQANEAGEEVTVARPALAMIVTVTVAMIVTVNLTGNDA